MAQTALTFGDYSAALEKILQDYIQDNIPSQIKLLSVLKTNDNTEFFNDHFYAPIRSNRTGGVVNLANENNKLRTGFAPTVQAVVDVKYLTGTFDIADPVKKATANNQGAVASALTFQLKALKTDFSKNVNRQYFSDGVGIVAQVSGSVGVGTLSVILPDSSLDDTRGDYVDYFGPINYDIKPNQYIAPGQAIGIGTAGAGVGTVTTSTGGTALGTIVVTGSPAIVAADAVYFNEDGDNSAPGTSDIQGVRLALSTGTANYAGLARSFDLWSPQFMGTAGNGALSVPDMDVIYMSAQQYAQNGDRYAWFMNKTLYAKFGQLQTALRRTVNKMELTSGWRGLEYEAGNGAVGVFLDFDTPDGEAILLNLDTWTVCEVAPMGFVEDNLLRRSDYLTFQKVLSWYTNLLNVCPAANGRMLRRTR